jgi:TetR/AcrR family transcriptional regulator, mexCD-oprJ operon repressor
MLGRATATTVTSRISISCASEGAFRADLPATWLVSVLYHVLKGAAADSSSGRLDPADAPRFIVATVLAAYEP